MTQNAGILWTEVILGICLKSMFRRKQKLGGCTMRNTFTNALPMKKLKLKNIFYVKSGVTTWKRKVQNICNLAIFTDDFSPNVRYYVTREAKLLQPQKTHGECSSQLQKSNRGKHNYSHETNGYWTVLLNVIVTTLCCSDISTGKICSTMIGDRT